MDLVIEGKAFINNSFENCCIGIKNSKISKIKKILKGDKHLNFRKKLILPTGVDIHVHFREPGLTHKEDFSTGSISAAFGGISCFFDMPNTLPPTLSLNDISEKIVLAKKKSFVDFGIYAGITNNNIDVIDKLSKKTNGLKIYLGTTTNSFKLDKKKLRDAILKTSNTGKPVLIHAENEELFLKNKENNIVDHMRFRPSVCEETAIKDVLQVTKGLNINIHICHLTSIEGLAALKNRPNNISCGVTPHHLLLSADKNVEPKSFYKVNPPIRSNYDKESLFNCVENGFIDVIESDHAPHTIEEKSVDFDKAPSGIPGVETVFPLFLYLAKKKVITFQRVINLICKNPANILNVPKGSIETGKDADFIVIDLKEESKIKSNKLHSKCGWTPFEGWPAIFPSHVFVRGEKLIEDYEIQVKQGFGRFVGE